MTYPYHSLLPGCPLGKGNNPGVRWQRGARQKSVPSHRLRLQGNSLPSVGSRSKWLLRLAASRSKRHGWEGIDTNHHAPCLRVKFCFRKRFTPRSSLLLSKDHCCWTRCQWSNAQAAPAQPGRTQTPFGNGRTLRRWQSGRGRGPSESPASLCRYQQLTERNRDSCRPLRSALPFTVASLP